MIEKGKKSTNFCKYCGWEIPYEIIQRITENKEFALCEFCGLEINYSSINCRDWHNNDITINTKENLGPKTKSLIRRVIKIRKSQKISVALILGDNDFPQIFKENLIIVISRLIYLFIRTWEQNANTFICRVNLTKSLLYDLANYLKPIINKRISNKLLGNLFRLSIEEFEDWLKLLQNKIQLDQKYHAHVKIFLLWLTKTVFKLVSEMWEMKGLPKFEATIIKNLKNYPFEEIDSGYQSRNKKIKSGLPYDEEIVVKDTKGIVNKVQIGFLENSWQNLKILSINKKGKLFGAPKFIHIRDFTRSKSSNLLNIRLSDGRHITCTPDQIIPKMVIRIRNKSYDSTLNDWYVKYTKARDLNKEDNLLVLHKILLSSNVLDLIFIPSFLNWENRWVGIKRNEYLKFSYRTNQQTNDPLIQLINSKFQYSKVAKIYRTIWSNLSNSERQLLENEARRKNIEILIKIHERVGYWYSSIVPLTNDFFRYLGWYASEGSTDKNRIQISQSKSKNYENWREIINLLEQLNFPVTNNGNNMIRINSNMLMELTTNLCSKLAQNKRIPFELLTNDRINAFLDAYYKGDGDQLPNGLRRFTTVSKQLKNDLVSMLGAIGQFVSIHNSSPSDNCHRIVETKGKHYKRKFMGLLKFNSTTPVKIKSIKKIKKNHDIFNIKTDNGWFISTNGILVHDIES